MDVFKRFATDEKKENEGVWVDVGDGAELLVARAGNKKYSRLFSAAIEKHQRALDLKDDAADKISDEIVIGVMAESILLGWRGAFSFKGETLTHSVANAKRVLAVPDFRGFVSRLSNDFDAYRAAQEEAVGNT